MTHARALTAWWRSTESTRSFWNILLSLTGVHAVAVAYVVLWVVWIGPGTGLDTDTAGFFPQGFLDALIGYSAVSLALFLAATYASGYRQERKPGKVFFALTALYCGFTLAFVWLHFGMPRGLLFANTWMPLESVFFAPPLWPAYAAAALMGWRIARPTKQYRLA